MLKSHLYDVIEVPFPTRGMNEMIASDVLAFDYAAYLENILLHPLGKGRARYGARSIVKIDKAYAIKKIFSYMPQDQLLLFTSSFAKEGNTAQTWVQTPSSLEITLNNDKSLRWYQKGTFLKVTYEYAGTHEIILPIDDVRVDSERKKINLDFKDNSFPIAGGDIKIKEISYCVGGLYLYDCTNKKISVLERGPLSIHEPMGSVLYRGRLLLTNGIDPVMMWDGKTLTQLKELPRFKNLFAHKNRLWGTSSTATEMMHIYFMKTPDALPEKIEAWGIDKVTKMSPFIDLSLKGIEDDEILKMEALGDKIVFFCKEHLQVWRGFNPLDPKDFIFDRGINEGLLHPNLTLPYANEILFVSPFGVKSLSSLNVGQQIAVSDVGRAGSFIKGALRSQERDKDGTSFIYQEEGMLGFKVGDYPCLILLPKGEEKIVTLFSGPFEIAPSIISHKERLYLVAQNELLIYEDGKKAVPLFYDEYEGDVHPIFIKWIAPFISFKGKRYQGKRYQVNCTLPSSFFSAPQNELYLKIMGDVSDRLFLKDSIPYYFHGDILGSHVSAFHEKEGNVFHLDREQKELSGRSGFVARGFHLSLEGEIVDGPVDLSTVLLYGRKER